MKITDLNYSFDGNSGETKIQKYMRTGGTEELVALKNRIREVVGVDVVVEIREKPNKPILYGSDGKRLSLPMNAAILWASCTDTELRFRFAAAAENGPLSRAGLPLIGRGYRKQDMNEDERAMVRKREARYRE